MNIAVRSLSERASDAPARPRDPIDDADILVMSGYYFPEPTGSAPPISDLSFWLAENGARTRVVTARPSYPRLEVLEGYRHGERDHEELRGVAVQRLAAFVAGSRGLVGRFRTEFSLLGRLMAARCTGRVKPARYVISVCPSIFVVAAAPLFRARGGRSLCIVHDIQSGLGSSLGFSSARPILDLLRKVEAWAFNQADVLVALSESMATELRNLGVRTPIVVLPPQIDVRELGGLPEAEGAPTLLYSGNLGRKQGLDQVLALAGALQARGSPARLLIRGEGSERAELERHAAELQLANLTFTDLAAREQIRAAFAEGAVHLVPQNPDTASFAVPSKVFSIMAAERPFIATADPGSPLDRLARTSGGGVCVKPFDPEGMADAVELMLSSDQTRRRMGLAGRAYVESKVDREVVCRGIWEALRGEDADLAELNECSEVTRRVK